MPYAIDCRDQFGKIAVQREIPAQHHLHGLTRPGVQPGHHLTASRRALLQYQRQFGKGLSAIDFQFQHHPRRAFHLAQRLAAAHRHAWRFVGIGRVKFDAEQQTGGVRRPFQHRFDQ